MSSFATGSVYRIYLKFQRLEVSLIDEGGFLKTPRITTDYKVYTLNQPMYYLQRSGDEFFS